VRDALLGRTPGDWDVATSAHPEQVMALFKHTVPTGLGPYDGQADIAERRLRAVGPTGRVHDDAVARFTEDGLRVMRAVRFAAALELTLDPDTERGIAPALPLLARVSKERICDELRKTLAARSPSRALVIAERTQIIALILPELAAGLEAWAA